MYGGLPSYFHYHAATGCFLIRLSPSEVPKYRSTVVLLRAKPYNHLGFNNSGEGARGTSNRNLAPLFVC